ncbi:MAG: tetratricopeptide repeat protein, partial [Candidatus Delongbacteria bacterium]|nr:tetratricopeptide repeat protein [Candidatus Delongbacteria bacterium]
MKINFSYIICSIATVILLSGISILSAQSTRGGYKIDSHDDILEIVSGEEKVNVLLQKSMFEMNRNNDQEKGIEYLLKARDLSKEINYLHGIISSHSTLGDIYYSSGNYNEAINYYMEAVYILKTSEPSIDLYSLYAKIGWSYYEQNDFDNLIKYCELSLEIGKIINNKQGKKNLIAKSFYSMTLGYRGKFEYDKALEYTYKALKIYEETKNYWGIGKCYNAIGDLNEMQGNYKIAFESYKKAKKLFEDYNSPGDLSVIYFNLASMSKVFGNYNEALMYLEKSLKISLSIKSERMIKDCYFGL